eukprot:TRINITY_DN2253_c0_g1_i1.p1 TRINITY_DN2253_c0_g1~~TRINITY_DN2253_c0_g1_i1.p1  ORF type:complete len:341 (+),score=18.04 TRINITY_DN2253_c0_g1_i1:129-1151(+)
MSLICVNDPLTTKERGEESVSNGEIINKDTHEYSKTMNTKVVSDTQDEKSCKRDEEEKEIDRPYHSEDDHHTKKRLMIKCAKIFVMIAIIIVFALVFPTKEYFLLTLNWLAGLNRFQSAAGFIFIYIVSTLLLLPGVVLTVFSGYLYGLWWGTALSCLGSTCGALSCFIAGRKVFRNIVQKWATKYKIIKAINSVLENKDGFKVVLLLRLSPITPYSVLNYLLSTTRIKYWSYLLSTMIGLIPGTFMYCYLGTAARSMTEILNQNSSSSESKTIRGWIFIISLIVTVLVVTLVAFVSARAIKTQLRMYSIEEEELKNFVDEDIRSNSEFLEVNPTQPEKQ